MGHREQTSALWDPELSCDASFPACRAQAGKRHNREGPARWPRQAGIFLDSRYLCEGALISQEWALTGANCSGGWVQWPGRVMERGPRRGRPASSPPAFHSCPSPTSA